MTARERISELRKFINSGDPVTDELLAHLDALARDLEGEREWGIKYPNGYIGFVGTKENASFGISDSSVLVSRRKAGQWEEE